METILNASEDQQTAIAHLSMLRQMATGEAKRKTKDAEERFTIIANYVLTGSCVADDETKVIVEQLKEFRPLAKAA